jgi:hypothetical protein
MASFSLKEVVIEFFTKSLLLFLLSLVFFVGGIVLLALQIPGWSLFLGLPAVQIGIVCLIFTFEAISRQKSTLPSKEYHLVDCLVCGRQTMAPKYIQKKICDNCQVKIAQRLKAAFVVIFILFTIPMAFSLVRGSQELRRKAVEPPITCEPGEWHPPECYCGIWQENRCPLELKARKCEEEIFCCQKEDSVWQCQPLWD